MDPLDDNEPSPEFSDTDRDNIVASISEEDLRQRSQALDDAQETWEETAYLANPKMPCPECTGAGSISGGSLGDICVRCLGARVIEQPGRQKVEMPPFAALRASISAYGDALADRELPAGHKGKRHLALPAPATVVTLEQIQKLAELGLSKARQLEGASGIVPKHLLADPTKARGLTGEGDLGEYTDAEFAEMEDAANEKASKR